MIDPNNELEWQMLLVISICRKYQNHFAIKMTNIEGFSHLLEQGGLTAHQEWEYSEIVAASIDALLIETRRHEGMLKSIAAERSSSVSPSLKKGAQS